MGGLQSKKYCYEASTSNSESQSSIDDKISKQRSIFKRKYRPVSASPAGTAAAARILSRFSLSPVKKRLQIDKNMKQEASSLKNAENIEKETHFGNSNKNIGQKTLRRLKRKMCLPSRPYRKFFRNPTDEEQTLLNNIEIELQSNCEADQSLLKEAKKESGALKWKKCNTGSRYKPYERTMQNRTEELEDAGRMTEVRRTFKPNFLSEIPEEQAIIIEKVMAELKERFAKRNLEQDSTKISSKAEISQDSIVISAKSTLLEEILSELQRRLVKRNLENEMKSNLKQSTTEISSQAENSQDSIVVSARTTLLEEITKELKRRIARGNLGNEIKSKIKLQILSKIPQERVVIMEKLMTELKQQLTERQQLVNNNKNINNDEEEISTIPQTVLKKEYLKPISTRQHTFLNKRKSRYSPYEMAKQKQKQGYLASAPNAFGVENLDGEARRTLNPHLLTELPREQVILIENVMSELKACLAKRNVELKNAEEVKPLVRCIESTELEILPKIKIITV